MRDVSAVVNAHHALYSKKVKTSKLTIVINQEAATCFGYSKLSSSGCIQKKVKGQNLDNSLTFCFPFKCSLVMAVCVNRNM